MPDSQAQPLPSPPTASVAIIGTDVALAAFPATPVQVAHACRRLGFDLAVPASWGDELVAAATMERLADRPPRPAVLCGCPLVAERLLASGRDLAPALVSIVSPPVATARYVRALWGDATVRVTYLGGCPGAVHEDIDARLTPRDFLHALHERGIVPAELPRVFDSVLPPDRRRHLSLPGGAPTRAALATLEPPRTLHCLTSADYAAELAQCLLTGEPVVMDLAPRLGCLCAGALPGTPFDRARETVAALEPPRAPAPVIERDVVLALDAPLPFPAPPAVVPDAPVPPAPAATRVPATRPASALAARPASPRPLQHTPQPHARYAGPVHEPLTNPRRRPVTGFFRGYTSDVPRTRSGEGQALPRAYVGLRRGTTADVATRAPEVDLSSTDRERPVALSIEPVADVVASPAPAPVAVAPATAVPAAVLEPWTPLAAAVTAAEAARPRLQRTQEVLRLVSVVTVVAAAVLLAAAGLHALVR